MLPLAGSGSPSAGQVLSSWVTLDGSSNSDITNTGVRDPNAPGSTALSAGDYSLMSFSTPGWTWTNTGTQSSTLNETVGETQQSMPDLATGTPVVFTTQTALEQTTSATELGHSATVLRTSTGSSTMGNSWGWTSTEGSYSSPGLSGISMRAHALVPVGSDGLSYAMNNNPTNYVGDYLWTWNDLLGGGSSAAPEAQGFTRNVGAPLATQTTYAATAGSSTTNSDHAGSFNSETYSSSGNTAYGAGGSSSGSTAEAEAMFGPAGLIYVKTAGMIIEMGDAAAIKSLTNQIASGQATFIVCDGNSCAEVTFTTSSGRHPGELLLLGSNGSVIGVQAAGQAVGMPPALADGTIETLEEVEEEIARLDIFEDVDYATGNRLLSDTPGAATSREAAARGRRSWPATPCGPRQNQPG